MRPYNSALSKRADELRNNATPQENHLWYDFLRLFRPRFTRQRIIGNFILDFFCGQAKLAVELDGSQHYQEQNMAYDIERTAFLNGLGIEVLRFPNNEVNGNFNAICETIALKVRERLREQPPPSADGTPFVCEGG